MKYLSRSEVRDIDRRAIEEYGIPGIVLMENAGRGVAQHILTAYGGTGPHVIACGGGNNGGDGFVIARHLSNAGVDVTLLLAADVHRLPPDARTNYEIIRRMQLDLRAFVTDEERRAHASMLSNAAVIVDALLGTGFVGDVRPPLDAVIRAINDCRAAHAVAVDLPSGLDCDTGRPAAATVRAELTVTFVAPKLGFAQPHANAYTGRVVVADIGAPASLLTR